MKTLECAFLLGFVGCVGIFSQTQGPLNTTPVPKSAYLLGPNDQITVDVVELPEFAGKSYRIDSDGSVSLPLLGRVHAGGLSLSQFEVDVKEKLRSQVRNPHVSTNVVESRSQPVSVMGAVNTPGTQQLQGNKTLFDVIAMAGGLKPDAGDVIKITRQPEQGHLGIAGTTEDPTTGRTTAELNIRDIVELKDSRANIVVRPHDEIAVSQAKVLYVIGNVRKPGGFTLSEHHELSALEALSLAEGLGPNAAPGNTRILRRNAAAGADREQVPINLKKILSGKAPDVQLHPGDILFIPDNTTRRLGVRAAETALSTVSGLVIWRGL